MSEIIMKTHSKKIVRISTILIFIAIAWGFYLRTDLYLSNRSLWLNTAGLAVNIVEHS